MKLKFSFLTCVFSLAIYFALLHFIGKYLVNFGVSIGMNDKGAVSFLLSIGAGIVGFIGWRTGGEIDDMILKGLENYKMRIKKWGE